MTEDEKLEWFSDEAATFGDRIAAAREAAGLTQKDLSKRLGVKLSTLQNWEEDLNEPRANKLQMAAGILGVSLSWLLTGEGEGVDPDADPEIDTDGMNAILTDMREMRAQMVQSAERLKQLEKRLKALLKDPV